MRITFVLPPLNMSGGIRVLACHAEQLRRRGHHVRVVTVPAPRPTWREILGSLLRGRGWPKAEEVGPSHFDGLAVERRVLDHPGPVTDADLPDADAVIATWWETARWVAALSPSKGAKAHFMQGYETFAGAAGEVEAAYRLPMPKIVVSRWLQEVLERQLGQTPAAVVPNSVDLEQFHAPPRGKQAAPTVGLIYSPDRVKGTDIVLKAYAQAAQSVPGLRLVAMSSHPLCPELPLPHGTEFIYQARGQVLRDTYARCDAWLSGSRAEGFGLPILEAMACRTPVIATPAGAAPELLSKGSGILVPQEDPEAMARAIVTICTLPEDAWRAMSDAAWTTATSYTWESAGELFEQALEKIVGQSPSVLA
jgi:glycosyltransferase involved in cell wall biosynthesis